MGAAAVYRLATRVRSGCRGRCYHSSLMMGSVTMSVSFFASHFAEPWSWSTGWGRKMDSRWVLDSARLCLVTSRSRSFIWCPGSAPSRSCACSPCSSASSPRAQEDVLRVHVLLEEYVVVRPRPRVREVLRQNRLLAAPRPRPKCPSDPSSSSFSSPPAPLPPARPASLQLRRTRRHRAIFPSPPLLEPMVPGSVPLSLSRSRTSDIMLLSAMRSRSRTPYLCTSFLFLSPC